jgi:hypothetical protein
MGAAWTRSSGGRDHRVCARQRRRGGGQSSARRVALAASSADSPRSAVDRCFRSGELSPLPSTDASAEAIARAQMALARAATRTKRQTVLVGAAGILCGRGSWRARLSVS